MTNTELLELKIKEKGLKKSYLAKKIGLSLSGFRNCCINKTEFKASQIQRLCDELDIKTLEEQHSIFFSQKVHNRHQKEDNL